MPSSIYFPSNSHRPERIRHKSRQYSNGSPLPHISDDKLHRRYRSTAWVIPFSVPIPGHSRRRLRLWYLSPSAIHQTCVSQFGAIRGKVMMLLAFICLTFVAFALVKRFGTRAKQWPKISPGDPTTLIFRREDLQKIWRWEVESGHHPSRRPIPAQLAFLRPIDNPALPPENPFDAHRFQYTSGVDRISNRLGPRRIYPDIHNPPLNVAYPPRPIPGSIADFDLIMEYCDFSQKKYVRDCLEFIKMSAALDSGVRIRRGHLDEHKYMFVEDTDNSTQLPPSDFSYTPQKAIPVSEADLSKRRDAEWEPPLQLPPPIPFRPANTMPSGSPCDPDSPRIFHMFWTGALTDKPYTAILSFLYTQNLGLDLPKGDSSHASRICKPQFWLWIDLDPSSPIPRQTAVHDMYKVLMNNPWSAPFLHPRFKDIIHFKLWNTTEQLDGIPELRDEWRKFPTLFTSGGYKVKVSAKSAETTFTSVVEQELDMSAPVPEQKTPTTDNSLSTIMSDMARFVLCHRHGGIYLDADTLLLRDWEDLWGWKGAFAYRWSYHDKYNTAVLRLNKGSALGSFLFRTALKNDLDFHPMIVSRYLKDAMLEDLLFRLPDALFDSAFLTMEGYQHERPPVPMLKSFDLFFETPALESAAAQALGFDGFFRGAYSYHYHNSWQRKLFDPSRNWPDLGPNFIASEEKARAAALAVSKGLSTNTNETMPVDYQNMDKPDLDWATIVKRRFESYIRGERPNLYGEWLVW